MTGFGDYPGSGGWRAGTVRDRTRIGPDIPFLASEKYIVKRSGATFKKQTPTAAVAEVQTLVASAATAGTFTLTFNGETTAPLAFNATAATVQAALQALTAIGAGGILATGGPAQTANIVLTFAGPLAEGDQPLITINKTGLTGGAAAAVNETTRGKWAGVVEIRKGTFVHPDSVNVGYYKAWATGETIITDGTVGPPGFVMESINVADGDVTEGLLIQGSVLAARVQPQPLPAAVLTAITGRISLQ